MIPKIGVFLNAFFEAKAHFRLAIRTGTSNHEVWLLTYVDRYLGALVASL